VRQGLLEGVELVEQGVSDFGLSSRRGLEAATAPSPLTEAGLRSTKALGSAEAAPKAALRLLVRVGLRSSEAPLRVSEALRLLRATELSWEALRSSKGRRLAELSSSSSTTRLRVSHRPGRGRLIVLVVVGAEGVAAVRLCARAVVRR
jgi:hypothetical protein